MSHKFIQTRYNPEKATLWLKPEEIKEKAGQSFALLIPKIEDGVHYNKAIVECAVNILVQTMATLRPNPAKTDGKIDFEKTQQGQTEYEVHEKMMAQMNSITKALGYMVNCTSWREGLYLSFDELEINRRLEIAKTT